MVGLKCLKKDLRNSFSKIQKLPQITGLIHKMIIIAARNNSNEVLRHEASSLNQRRKTTMEQIKKDPRQIVHHSIFSHNNCCSDGQSELVDAVSDSLAPKSKTFSKCKDARASSNCLENSDEHWMDETFLEHFWDITSPEEFAHGVKSLFERS